MKSFFADLRIVCQCKPKEINESATNQRTMSFCEICNTTECDLCNAPMPTLERQTNQVGPREAYLGDEHEECDDEPCACCLERWECDLDALKTLDEIDGLTAYHLARHEKMVDAGKRRLARETRLAAALAAEIAALEAAYGRAAAEARKAYIASYDPVADAQCFSEFQRDLSERRAREAPGVKRARLEEPSERGAYQVAKRARLEEPLVLEMPPIPILERQTNDHPINYQAPQPRCLVKNCSCEASGTIARLVKRVNGELVHY